MSTLASDQYALIVGMGATGLSIARFLAANGESFKVFDTRPTSALSSEFGKLTQLSNLLFETLSDEDILGAARVYLSPGVARSEPVVQRALHFGKDVVGDIALFIEHVNKPVIGITGSNGKSTVTTIVGKALEAEGVNVAVGGNIGTPALELLSQDADIYILELSSFQLESVEDMGLRAACILNLSEDHMDRYPSLEAYADTKRKIFDGAQNIVFNASDKNTWPRQDQKDRVLNRYTFGQADPLADYDENFSFCPKTGWLREGQKEHIAKQNIKIKGTHNIENALAVMAILRAAGFGFDGCKRVLATFGGLPHRCQHVATIDDITFINDSKGTNAGATVAAVEGLAPEFSQLHLIAGGVGKEADFSALGECISRLITTLILIGQDAQDIAQTVKGSTEVVFADDMAEAIKIAKGRAKDKDAVLLSPACASFDMFANFEDRGEQFIACVNAIQGEMRAS